MTVEEFCAQYYQPQTQVVTYFDDQYLARVHKDRLELYLQLPSGEPRNIILGGNTKVKAHPELLVSESPDSTPLT